MLSTVADVEVNGLAVKFVKARPTGVANPVMVPLLEIPLLFVPIREVVPATGPSKFSN
jgi:hypothetical protein